MTTSDDEIRERFDDLRALDRADVPSFAAMRDRVAEQPSVLPARRVPVALWVAAAASVVVVATFSVSMLGRRDAADITRDVPSITSWTSPTDELLRMSPAASVMPPSVFGSVLDGAVAPVVSPDSSKGDGL